MRIAMRREDMSAEGFLRLFEQEDGDIVVEVHGPNTHGTKEYSQNVEFCTTHGGGGKSPRTLRALRELMKAMEEDNATQNLGGRARVPKRVLLRGPERCAECNKVYLSIYALRCCKDHESLEEI